MKKRIVPILILFILVSMVGCGAKSNDSMGLNRAEKSIVGEGFMADADTESKEAAVTEKKMIKTADVVIEAKDVSKVYAAILDFAKDNGGYEFSQSTSSYEDSKTIEATIKIVPASLDKLMSFAGSQGDLISSSLDSEDITDSYYDSEIRLNSLRNQLEKYNGFLKDTKSIDEMMRVQTEIDRLIIEIEALEGRLAKWDKLVDEATVRFTITQKADPSLKRRKINWNALSFSDMGYLITSGIVTVLTVLVSILQWLAIAILVTSPLWVPAAVILLIIFRKKIALARRKRKESKAATAAPESDKY